MKLMMSNKTITGFNLNKLYSHTLGQWILAGLISLFILVVVFILIQPVFMTIDDARLLYVYAGYMTGQPEGNYLFCYYPLGYIISRLYTLFPQVSWYALYHFVLIGFSSTAIGKTVYQICYSREYKIYAAFFLHVFMHISILLISTILIHFEITATAIGTAGVIVFTGIDFKKDNLSKVILEFIISIICILICFIVQYNSFYAICCYLLVAVMYHLCIGIQDQRKKKTLVVLCSYIICLICLVFMIKNIENVQKSSEEWSDYLQYNKYRVSFWDYPHSTYDENPELFESVGWSEEFYNLTENMYFMDERFNQENLSKIVNRFSWFRLEEPSILFDNWKESFHVLFNKEKISQLHLVLMGIALICLIMKCSKKENWKRYYPALIASICCIGGTMIIVFYLAMRGRLPLRAWLACLIPCGILVGILLLMTSGKKKIDIHYYILGTLIWIFLIYQSYEKVIVNDWTYRQNSITQVQQIEQYAVEHPENLYVYDMSGAQNYGVFTKYVGQENYPVNLIPWGSSYLYTPVYYQQLQKNGKTQLLSENLTDLNVYYITSSQNLTYKRQLREMLMQDYQFVNFVKIEDINEQYTVYKIKCN